MDPVALLYLLQPPYSVSACKKPTPFQKKCLKLQTLQGYNCFLALSQMQGIGVDGSVTFCAIGILTWAISMPCYFAS